MSALPAWDLDGPEPSYPEMPWHGEDDAAIEGEERPHTWTPRDIGPVLDGTWTAITPTIGRRDDGVPLLYPARTHSAAGETEAGKSWFAGLITVQELAAGRGVLYLDFEDDAEGVVSRLLAMGATNQQLRAHFAYIQPEDPVTAYTNASDLMQAKADVNADSAFIDGVTEAMSMHGLNPLDNLDIAKFNNLLAKPLARAGLAVLSLDHVTKDPETRGRYSIGGVHKLNIVTGAAFSLQNRTPFGIGTTGKSTVRLAKDRIGQLRRHALPGSGQQPWLADLVLNSHGEDFVEASMPAPISRPDDFRPTVLMSKIAAAIDGAPTPLSQTDIEDRVRGKAQNVRSALAHLIDEGYVVVEPGPRNARLHRLVKPFTEEIS